VLVAAVLHDTIEDTETTEQELLRLFGKDVADIEKSATTSRCRKTSASACRSSMRAASAGARSS
jgi:(p)ppGpp synthase/HD superfamily hydrolase